MGELGLGFFSKGQLRTIAEVKKGWDKLGNAWGLYECKSDLSLPLLCLQESSQFTASYWGSSDQLRVPFHPSQLLLHLTKHSRHSALLHIPGTYHFMPCCLCTCCSLFLRCRSHLVCLENFYLSRPTLNIPSPSPFSLPVLPSPTPSFP